MGRFLLLVGIMLASGPRPDKKDVPYLVHASALVQTEVVQSTVQDTADATTYTVPGETSPARTPLALPIFLLDAADIRPEKMRLIRLTAVSGHREGKILKQPSPDDPPLLLTVTSLGGGLYRFEVVNEIENGEYALNAAGSDRLFCFTVF
jgi:hypothetical protein